MSSSIMKTWSAPWNPPKTNKSCLRRREAFQLLVDSVLALVRGEQEVLWSSHGERNHEDERNPPSMRLITDTEPSAIFSKMRRKKESFSSEPIPKWHLRDYGFGKKAGNSGAGELKNRRRGIPAKNAPPQKRAGAHDQGGQKPKAPVSEPSATRKHPLQNRNPR